MTYEEIEILTTLEELVDQGLLVKWLDEDGEWVYSTPTIKLRVA